MGKRGHRGGRRRRPIAKDKKQKRRVKLTRRDLVFIAICIGAVALVVIVAPLLFKSEGDTHLSEVQTYVGSAEHKIFHLPNCKALQWFEADDQVRFKSRAEAVADGQKPCAICKP